uniref:COMM domain-containing protein 3 n=1 Tax=Tetranychus urticae TaxID=32264 RepID=T1JXJ1_TETUR
MELCQDVMTGLSLLKDDSRLSKFQLIQLAELVGQSLVHGRSINSYEKIMDKCELKMVGLSVACLFLEAAKNNKTISEEISLIEMALSEASVAQDFVLPIVDQYKKIERDLKNRLLKMKIDDGRSLQSNGPKDLVDARWRQDVIIKSKSRNQINEINYLVDLISKDGTKISFSADLPGLQDLGYQLRDCCKVLENTFKNIN